jgi:hypothetical protein
MAKLTGKLLFIGIDPDSDELMNPTAFNTWGKMAYRINAGMAAYREAVIEGLVAEGHHMIEAMAMIRKGQVKEINRRDSVSQVEFIHELFGVSA